MFRKRLYWQVVAAFFAVTVTASFLVAAWLQLLGELHPKLLVGGAAATLVALFTFMWVTKRLMLPVFTEMRRLEDVRRDFVGNVSHELKTPLTAARGMVETLIDDPDMDPDTQRLFFFKIRDQTHRLSALVSDLLALSKIESGQIQESFEHLDLRSVVISCLSQLSQGLETKDLKVIKKLPAEAVFVKGDQESLEVAVKNLLDNAIKYSPERGEILLALAAQESTLKLSVADQGIGIEKSHHQRIFERFYRVDAARSRALGGTGLGLSIVKHIALAHGGNVGVESVVGSGTTFTLTLPQEAG